MFNNANHDMLVVYEAEGANRGSFESLTMRLWSEFIFVHAQVATHYFEFTCLPVPHKDLTRVFITTYE